MGCVSQSSVPGGNPSGVNRRGSVAGTPAVLVFDVNETLLDIASLGPHFERIFGDPASLRTWFGTLVTYSMTLTLSGYYVDFFTLGRAALKMLADTSGVDLTDDDRAGLTEQMRTMPAHPDVAAGLQRLLAAGYRLATLTNSPHRTNTPSPLDNAGLSKYFEKQFTVDTAGVYKPSTELYRRAAVDLEVPVSACMMVAAHAWDVIGALGAGMQGALITRPGNAALVADGVPQPTLIAADLIEFATRMESFGHADNDR
jgi:2-haloacid dehalogenase